MKIFRYIIILFFIPFFSFAVQSPQIIGTEARFRAYVYNPNEVYSYIGHYGFQTYIEFEEDEIPQTISMGDVTAWQTVILGNKLFLKPVESFPQTNMTVISNKRIYHFELDAVEGGGVNDDDMLFYIKFMYPSEDSDSLMIFESRKKRKDLPDLSDLSKYNFNYEFAGSKTIAPIKVFDDNEFTYFEFPDKDSDIPVIFAVNSNGYETLVNFRIVENYIVVERTSSQFTLRSGGDIVCVYNNSLYRK